MRHLLLIAALLVCGFANAASVVWGGGVVKYYAPGENWGYGEGIHIYDWWFAADEGRICPNVFMDVQSSVASADFRFLQKSDEDRYLRMNAGDAINATSMAEAGMPSETMHVDFYNTVFVAFETVAYKDLYTPYNVYGWVEFGFANPDGLIVVNGAMDFDGGPMIVGGGSAIPEPSGGLLLLFGAAAMALKRRRQT